MRAISLSIVAVLTAAAALGLNGLATDPSWLGDLRIGTSSAAALPDGDDDVVPGPLRVAPSTVEPTAARPAARRAAPPPPPKPAAVRSEAKPTRAVGGYEGRFRANRPDEEITAAARASVRLPERQLVFENFSVTDRPDLEVWLVAADRIVTAEDALGAKRVSLGRLKKPVGNQTYRLPPEIDVSIYRSVIVWSRHERFPRLTALLQPRTTR
jgi:hypothetical protein